MQDVPPLTSPLIERVARLCRSDLGERELRVGVLDELRRGLGFDAYAWLLTDPATWVGTAPLAEIPDLAELPRMVALKYCTTVNRWTGLPPRRGTLLSVTTGGRLDRSLVWRELLEGWGVIDVASISFADRHGSWGFLDLWRCGTGARSFTAADAQLLSAIAEPVTTALRRGQARMFASSSIPAPVPGTGPGPAVLVLDDRLHTVQQTEGMDPQLRALLPTAPDRAPVPAAALNAAAQLLAVEAGIDDHPPSARAHLADGPWISVRASRLHSPTEQRSGAIAVTIETLAPAERLDLLARATALTSRERQILDAVVQGSDNAAVADLLSISRYTVQDHLKSIFVKAACRSRTELIALASGAAYQGS